MAADAAPGRPPEREPGTGAVVTGEVDAVRRLRGWDVPLPELESIAVAFPRLRPVVAAHPNADARLRGQIAREVSAEVAAGTPPSPERDGRRPWLLAGLASVVAVLALLAIGVLGLGPWQAQGTAGDPVERGFASPEAAMRYLADRVAMGDMAGAGEAFATARMVDGYSFEDYVGSVGAVTPGTWLPSDTYRAMDLGLRRDRVSRDLRTFAWQLMAPSRDAWMFTEVGAGPAVAELRADLDPADLAGLSLVQVAVVPAPAVPAHVPNPLCGADERQQAAVLYATPTGTVMGAASFLRYGGRWYVEDLGASSLNLWGGELTPVTEQEYADKVAALGG